MPTPTRRRGFLRLVLTLSIATPFVPAAVAQAPPPPAAREQDRSQADVHRPRTLLVKFKEGVPAGRMGAVAKGHGAALTRGFRVPAALRGSRMERWRRLTLPPGQDVEAVRSRLAGDPAVDTVELDSQVSITLTPTDPGFGQLWGLHNTGQTGGAPDADIDAPEAWAMATGSREGPLVAILDTGADVHHPDLAANIWTNPDEVAGDGLDNDGNGVIDDVHGYNSVEDTGDPDDGHSHGTHVAGTVGAVGNNGFGVAGVNWQARMMPVKVYNDSGRTTAATIIRGINYATRMGARITSNSWGDHTYNQAMEDAFATSPALHVMAAGNHSDDSDVQPFYPAGYDLDDIIAVASTTKADERAIHTNYGRTTVDLAAPGSGVYSTMPGGGYGTKLGTSIATPHVSGAAALLLSEYPHLSNEDVKRLLLSTVDRLPAFDGKLVSGGRLNVARLLGAARSAP